MKTVLNVKIDRDVKIKAQKTAFKLGLPLSLVVGEHLRRFSAEESITFATAKKMSKILEHRLGKVTADIRAGHNLSPVFSSMEEAIAHLHE